MTSDKIQKYSKLKFAEKMGAVSGQTFEQVFRTNQEFVEFTTKSMSNGTGIFNFWQEYVKLLKKNAGLLEDVRQAT